MSKLFGLRITPLSGQPSHNHWVSILPERVQGFIKRHKDSPILENTLFGEIESQVVVDNLGWYSTGTPGVFVKILRRDLCKCHGWCYYHDGNTLLRLEEHHRWYLNGEPIEEAPYKLLEKVNYENPRKSVQSYW